MEPYLIVIIVFASLLFLFVLYLILGQIIVKMNLGAKALKTKNQNHLTDKNNIYEKIMDYDFDKKNNTKLVSISSYDKTKLNGFYYQSKKKSNLFILAAHGYGSCHLEQTILMNHLIEKYDLNLLLIDERAEASSGGKYCTMGDRESKDLLCWIKYIKSLNKDAKILLYGNSLGAATVLMCAARSEKDAGIVGVIADSAYQSAYIEFKKVIIEYMKIPAFFALYPLNLACILLHHFSLKTANVKENAKNIKIPTLLIHAGEDTFIPPHDMDLIYDNLPNDIEKEKHLFPKGEHCLASLYDREGYFKLIDSFIEKHLTK